MPDDAAGLALFLAATSFGASFRGGRPHNEDALGKREPRAAAMLASRGRLYIVADGMGGHRAGEVASGLAVETVLDAYYRSGESPAVSLSSAIEAANSRIAQAGASDEERAGMGCTVVACALHGAEATIGHVGDSRAYLLRAGAVRRLTRDHLYVIDVFGLSEDAAASSRGRHVLSRALGVDEQVKVDLVTIPIAAGDRLLLCTDGVTNVVTDDEIGVLLARPSPRAAVRRLLALARLRRTRDNASAIAVSID